MKVAIIYKNKTEEFLTFFLLIRQDIYLFFNCLEANELYSYNLSLLHSS